MTMKAHACPRCLTLSNTTEDGDGGAHTCTPTPLVRNLEARIAELETPPWNPIETAPQNGTEILVGGEGIVSMVIWLLDVGWQLAEPGLNSENDDICFVPTHWMPVPKPPTI